MFLFLAERGRFELPKNFRPCWFSKPVLSTTQPPLRASKPNTFLLFYQKMLYSSLPALSSNG